VTKRRFENEKCTRSARYQRFPHGPTGGRFLFPAICCRLAASLATPQMGGSEGRDGRRT
jgi:hypothetical protein